MTARRCMALDPAVQSPCSRLSEPASHASHTSQTCEPASHGSLTRWLADCKDPGASAKLASSEVLNIPNAWQDINEMKRFVCAFPTDNPHKRFLSQ